MKTRDLVTQMLAALQSKWTCSQTGDIDAAITAAKEYLAAPEQSELQDAKDTIELLEMRIDQLEAPEQSEPHPPHRQCDCNECKEYFAPEQSEPPYGSKRAAAMAVYTPPFKYKYGYIYDSQNLMVADNGSIGDDEPNVKGAVAARVRGWGRFGYLPNGAELQDEIGQMMADALTALYTAPPLRELSDEEINSIALSSQAMNYREFARAVLAAARSSK